MIAKQFRCFSGQLMNGNDDLNFEPAMPWAEAV